MNDLMTIARRHLAAARAGEKGDKGTKPPGTPPPLTPFSPFSPAPAAERWDQAESLRLLAGTTALAERLGVSGSHPDIHAAAAMMAGAYATRDMETVRFAFAEFVAVVRRVAQDRIPAVGGRGPTTGGVVGGGNHCHPVSVADSPKPGP